MGTYGNPRTISATGMVVIEARDMLLSARYEHGQNFALARRSTFSKKGCGLVKIGVAPRANSVAARCAAPLDNYIYIYIYYGFPQQKRIDKKVALRRTGAQQLHGDSR